MAFSCSYRGEGVLQDISDIGVPCRTKWSLITPTLKQQMTPEVSLINLNNFQFSSVPLCQLPVGACIALIMQPRSRGFPFFLPIFKGQIVDRGQVEKQFNPIQTGLFWSICDWGGGGGLVGPPLCISGTNNARVMKFIHNDHLYTKKPHTQF